MSEPIKPLAVDLSHWDPADDYDAVKHAGIVGVIYKATEGTGYSDDTYADQQEAAKRAGLKWGSYHFADGSDVDGQVENYLRFAAPDPDELFCLDWEDNDGDTMSAADAKAWISKVEEALDRPGECVVYSGNTAKELIDGSDPFFSARRLWLAQYSTTPVPQASWATYWLWQFTDGEYGPSPHQIDGIGPCDINSFAGSAQTLIEQWASGSVQPMPAPVPVRRKAVTIDVAAPDGVRVRVLVNGVPVGRSRHG